ncbi:MAG TPA: glycoside hydrolase family 88 protein, partial [Terriglobia bacterium]|nr:glycoside hydrolase family 88 protein [Terriglobia bacterium]
MKYSKFAVAGCALVFSLILSLPLQGAEHRDVGLSQSGVRIEAAVVAGPSSEAPTVLLVGGLAGNDESVSIVEQEVRRLEAVREDRRQFQLIAISLANPDGNRLQFPPAGVAYRENTGSHVLWRWIGIHAPDLVIIASREDFGLADALSKNVVAGTGRIPARHLDNIKDTRDIRDRILQSLPREIPPSEAHREIDRRLHRTARQVAGELAEVYGHDFNQLTYIPGLALIGQLRLGRISEVERLAAGYVDGSKNPLERPSSLTLAGHLVFAEIAERTGDPGYTELVRKAANLGFTETGEMKESMPFHEEMSDSVFMAIPLLAKAGKLTGDSRYFDMILRHLAFMQKLVLRPDGLYRHSPLSDAAWGRGNAFPALGLMLALSDLPVDRPQFAPLLRAFRQHMAALARFQDEDGLWREVIDYPGAYPEFSATAMIATAMLRGLNNGWLDYDEFQPLVEKAWRA